MSAATRKSYIHVAIAVVLFLLIRIFLKEGNGLTDKGVTVLALFLSTIWLWIFVGVDWTSLLVPGILIMTGVMSQTTALAVSFGNFCFAYVLATMLINVALESTGVIQQIATWFISRNICRGRPWVFLGLFLFSCVFVEFFLDCVPVTLIYLSMVDGICEKLGYEKGSKFGQALVLAILWLVVIPYGSTPISHPGAVLIVGFLNSINISVSFAQYMALGVPFSLVAFVLTMLILKILVRPDFSKFVQYDPDEMKKQLKPLTLKAKISVGVFFGVVLIWLMPDILSSIAPAASAYFKNTVSLVAPPILGVAILAIIRIGDEPILDLRKDLYKIPIPTLIFIVGIQAFASGLTNPEIGVSTYLGNLFSPLAQSVSSDMLMWIAMLLAVILTQFMSNIVVINLIWAAFLPVFQNLNAGGSNINIAAFGVILVLTANTAFIFPSSYVCAPMCYTSGYLEVKDGIKFGTPAVIALYLVLMYIFLPIANVIL
ncbi:MAG: hypothetical protein LBQ90_03655 [Synergistaceae bacterium]|jgi:sodium-dependent dicarboxylate transporter 2/3/5|nr:hypothetical protein [Synergistaceae bacterium]